MFSCFGIVASKKHSGLQSSVNFVPGSPPTSSSPERLATVFNESASKVDCCPAVPSDLTSVCQLQLTPPVVASTCPSTVSNRRSINRAPVTDLLLEGCVSKLTQLLQETASSVGSLGQCSSTKAHEPRTEKRRAVSSCPRVNISEIESTAHGPHEIASASMGPQLQQVHQGTPQGSLAQQREAALSLFFNSTSILGQKKNHSHVQLQDNKRLPLLYMSSINLKFNSDILTSTPPDSSAFVSAQNDFPVEELQPRDQEQLLDIICPYNQENDDEVYANCLDGFQNLLAAGGEFGIEDISLSDNFTVSRRETDAVFMCDDI